jgi:hypothetical protein
MESRLLDQFTRLLAYMGDEDAMDGYRNDSSVIGRSPPLDGDARKKVVRVIRALFDVDDDIIEKAMALKRETGSASASAEEKAELLQYMEEYENMNNMRGGLRRRKTKKRSRKHSRK